jgi:lambda family phage tail tape measure protein
MATTTDVYKLVVETDEALTNIANLGKMVSAAFTGMVGVVAAFADEITDTAASFNATTAEVIALSGALSAVGGKGDNAVKIFKGINDSISELNDGNLKTLKNFEELGIKISDLGSMSESAIREQVITNLGEMESVTERNTLAFKMFGKAATGVDFSKLAQEIKANAAESEKYAAAIDDAGAAYDSMAKILKQVKMAFAEAFGPIFKILGEAKVSTDAITTSFKVLAVAVAATVGYMAVMRTALMTITVAQVAFNTAVSLNPWVRVGALVVAAITAGAAALGLMKDDQVAVNTETEKQGVVTAGNAVKTAELNAKLKQQRDEVMKIGLEYKRNTQALEESFNLVIQARNQSQLNAQITQAQYEIEKKLLADIAAAKQDFNSKDSDYQEKNKQAHLATIYAMTKEAAAQKDITEGRMRTADLNQSQIRSALEAANIQVESAKNLKKMNDQMIQLTMNTDQRADAEVRSKQFLDEISKVQTEINNSNRLSIDQKKEYLKWLGNINSFEGLNKIEQELQLKTGVNIVAIINQQRVAAKALYDQQQKLTEQTNAFKTGWEQAFNSYYENATRASTMAGQAFSSITRGMESAIDRFVETGKFSMSDFATSVIKDLIKIEMKAQAMQLWNMMRGGAGGGGSLFSGLAGLLGFAEGGTPPVGRPSIVGENGPELFVPKSSGTIIPNNQLGGGGAANTGATGQVVNNNTYVTNNINALDAKSVAQLLQANKRQIFGIVESARRELPI